MRIGTPTSSATILARVLASYGAQFLGSPIAANLALLRIAIVAMLLAVPWSC